MHHVVLERWSRGQTALHRRDARVKIAVLLAYLVALATLPSITVRAAVAFSALPAAAIVAARLPVGGVLLRAALVLPFSGAVALFSVLAGDPARAVSVAVKSFLSAAAALVFAGTTPLPDILRGLAGFGAPRFLVTVVQFLYRYLFVISEQAQHMRAAAACRGKGSRRLRFRGAAGAAAVLFARSYSRAEAIHQAMLARGFSGRIELLTPARAGAADAAFFALGAATVIALRILAAPPR